LSTDFLLFNELFKTSTEKKSRSWARTVNWLSWPTSLI
jgi:hypothetical protein